MAKATWNGIVLADTDKYEVVEGNVYFPPGSIMREHFRESETDYECPWKGHADYHDIIAEGKVVKDAAWYYPDPKPAAKNIKEHVAFDLSKGIKVEE